MKKAILFTVLLISSIFSSGHCDQSASAMLRMINNHGSNVPTYFNQMVTSKAECAAMCMRDSNCTLAAFRLSDKLCRMKDPDVMTARNFKPNLNVVSMFKSKLKSITGYAYRNFP